MRERDGSRAQGVGGGPHQYGWPYGGTYEPNVLAQFVMNVASGDVTDTVGGSYALSAVGAPTYETDSSSYSGSMAKAITYDGSSNSHTNTSANSDWDLAGDGCTIEWVVAATAVANPSYHWTINGAESNILWGFVCYQTSATNLTLSIRSDDTTVVSNAYTISSIADGVYRKYLFRFNPDGNSQLFINEQSQGVFATTTLSEKAITHQGIRLGGQYNGAGADLNGSMVEWRWSKNLTNNSG